MTIQSPRSTCKQQAEAVLQAWVSGDDRRLRRELNKSMEVSTMSPEGEVEEERAEVLTAVAHKMLSSYAAPSAEDPEVRLCVDLLVHLAGPQSRGLGSRWNSDGCGEVRV